MTQAEKGAGPGFDEKIRLGRNDGIKAFPRLFKLGSIGFQIAQEVEPEFIERKISEGNRIVKVFKIEDFILQQGARRILADQMEFLINRIPANSRLRQQ